MTTPTSIRMNLKAAPKSDVDSIIEAINTDSNRKSKTPFATETGEAGSAVKLQQLLHDTFENSVRNKAIEADLPPHPKYGFKPTTDEQHEPIAINSTIEPDTKRIAERGNTRVFDRINVDGTVRFEQTEYRINDLSVGGLSVLGGVLGWEEGEIRLVQFTIRHGEMKVSGNINCQCLENGGRGISRFRLVNPSEDITEFFRTATLRSVSGADYDVGWLPENSSNIQKKENQKRKSLVSHILSLPMLVLVTFLLLLVAFTVQRTGGEAYWFTEKHEIVSPVTGKITTLETGPFDVGEPISEIIAMTVTGENLPFTVRANVASVSVDWRFSTGDHIKAEEVLGHLHNVPRNRGRFFAIVSLQIPFFHPGPGDSVVMKSIDGQRIVGEVRRVLTRNQARNHPTNNAQFAPNKVYALVEISGGKVDFSAAPEVLILETVLENTFR